jgi:cation diffusion facilitator family transporter
MARDVVPRMEKVHAVAPGRREGAVGREIQNEEIYVARYTGLAASSRKIIYAALVGNFLIAVTKFIAAAVTGSSAMLSEGIHSVVDTGNQVILLYGLHRAKRPPDAQFPFGHGKEIYFWSFVVSILIFAVGAGISIYEGIHHTLHPSAIESPHINYIVLGCALVFEGVAWGIAFKEFSRVKGPFSYIQAVQRGKDPSMFVVLFEDSAAIAGILVAFLGVLLGQVTGNPYFDGFASIVIGLILGATAIWLARETKSLLVGESANREVVDGIREIAKAFEDIEHVNEVLTLHMGPEYILVNLSVNFADHLTADDVEDEIYMLTAEIKRAFPRVKRIFVEPEERRVFNRKGEK